MRCPWCGREDDKVIDSRSADGGEAVRRRRQCLACGRRYTTFERVEELGITVVKRNGTFEPYDRSKVLSGIQKAVANRPVTEEQVAAVVGRVEDRLRRRGPRVTSERVGIEILGQLAKVDEVAYLRFASVYKDFQAPSDFARELGMLRKKSAKTRTP
ncbi:MAG: transcriptional regulator NrdR [Actinomycetota bacterium]